MDVVLLGGAPDFDEPLAFLRACHGRITQRLDALERALGEVGDPAHGNWEPLRTVFAWLRQYFDTSGRLHTADEEESIFPRLRETRWFAEGGKTLLERLEADHARAERLYGDLAERMSRLPPVSAAAAEALCADCREWIGIYRAHIEVEDADLAAAIGEWLPDTTVDAIGREMRVRRGTGRPMP